MKAVRIHQYGSVDVLRYEDSPCPEPASDEVLIRVHAAGINPADWKTRAGGGMSFMLNNPFPMIHGWDVSGVVETAGGSVARFKPGDAVFGMARFPEVGSAYAEYATVPEGHLSLKPENVDHVHAAAIPLAALTAWQALFEHASLQAGQRLLIQGASGGVGHLAVQIAKWKGAYVIGMASEANLDFLRSLGVDEALRYSDTVAEPVDMVLDTVGGELLNRSLERVKAGGSLISITGAPDPDQAKQYPIRTGGMLVHAQPDHLDQIAELMAAGALIPAIGQVFPITEVQQAHRAGENRTIRRGKLVLRV